jgi:hypothetical protein
MLSRRKYHVKRAASMSESVTRPEHYRLTTNDFNPFPPGTDVDAIYKKFQWNYKNATCPRSFESSFHPKDASAAWTKTLPSSFKQAQVTEITAPKKSRVSKLRNGIFDGGLFDQLKESSVDTPTIEGEWESEIQGKSELASDCKGGAVSEINDGNSEIKREVKIRRNSDTRSVTQGESAFKWKNDTQREGKIKRSDTQMEGEIREKSEIERVKRKLLTDYVRMQSVDNDGIEQSKTEKLCQIEKSGEQVEQEARTLPEICENDFDTSNPRITISPKKLRFSLPPHLIEFSDASLDKVCEESHRPKSVTLGCGDIEHVETMPRCKSKLNIHLQPVHTSIYMYINKDQEKVVKIGENVWQAYPSRLGVNYNQHKRVSSVSFGPITISPHYEREGSIRERRVAGKPI